MYQPITQSTFASFSYFLQNWLVQHRSLQQLLINTTLIPQEAHTELLNRVLSHYHKYYYERARVTGEDVSMFFSPAWLEHNSVADFRASSIFHIVYGWVGELTIEQTWRMQMVNINTNNGEMGIDEELASILRDRDALVGVLTRVRMLEDDKDHPSSPEMKDGTSASAENLEELETLLDAAINGTKILNARMVQLVANTDVVRERTIREVVAILTPIQGVRFLATLMQFQLPVWTSTL